MSMPTPVEMARSNGKKGSAGHASADQAVPAYPSPLIAWWGVSVLALMYTFSFIDRQIMSLLVGPMQRDMHLTDVQIGILQGAAFALLYTFLGVPIARLSDRYSRRAIIGAGVFIWSIMAVLTGVARNAVQLFMARVGVGIGEATLSPASYSIITDSFPRPKLGAAFAIYTMAIPIGGGIALLAGGFVIGAVSTAGHTFTLPLIGTIRTWQVVFVLTGAPGILLPLLLLTFREPARRGFLRTAAQAATRESPRPPVREVAAYMWSNRDFYAPHCVALGLLALAGYAVGAWFPTAVIRAYRVSASEVGILSGISTIVMCSSGMFFAGKFCDRLTRRSWQDSPIVVAALSAGCVAVLSSIPVLMPTTTLMWVLVFVSGFPFLAFNGVGPQAVNQITPNQYRAQVSAVYLFIVDVLGLAVGPAIVPIVNKYVFHNPAQIRYSLAIVVFCAAGGAAYLLIKERPVYRRKQVEAARLQ